MLIGVIDRLKEMVIRFTSPSEGEEKEREGERAVQVHVFFVDRSLSPFTTAEEVMSGAVEQGERGGDWRDDQIVQLLRGMLRHRFHRVPHNIDVIRDVIAATRLDFLIFSDIGMDMITYSLSYSRLAPYQVRSG